MEKFKKANECRNNLIVGIKVAKLPYRVPVASQLCEQKTPIKYQNAVMSAENYAFDKLKNSADSARRKSLEKLDENIKKSKKQQNFGEKYFENHSNFMSAVTMKLFSNELIFNFRNEN